MQFARVLNTEPNCNQAPLHMYMWGTVQWSSGGGAGLPRPYPFLYSTAVDDQAVEILIKKKSSVLTYVCTSLAGIIDILGISAISTASEGECLLNRIAVKYVCRWCRCDKAYYAHVVASMG